MGKINTLVFAGGAIHDWKGCSQEIIKSLSQRDEFELTTVEEDLDALAEYLVSLLPISNDLKPEAQK